MPRSRRPQRRRRSGSGRSAGGISQIPPSGLRGPVSFRGRRTRRWVITVVAGVLALAIIAGFIVGDLFSILPQQGRGTDDYRGGVGDVQARMTLPTDIVVAGRLLPAGSEDARHLSDTDPDFPEYSTVPPSSGPHLGRPWGCGFFVVGYVDPVTGGEGVPDRALVHNLEHGNIVMSYNLPNQEDVDHLQAVHFGLTDHDQWLVTRPYDEIEEGKVAMTAWGVLDTFDGVDEERINSFYDAYSGNRFSEETSTAGRGIPCVGTPQSMEPSAG